VEHARAAQRERFGTDNTRLNGRMTSRQLRKHCALDEEGKGLLKEAMDSLGLSARAHDRILRVARTVADLEGSLAIRPGHVIEAIGYRSLDRKLWAR
ncbi:MAG: magnesium chelatase, partial [Gemmataceae bacterium]|nr:magnesium chelatase [Gemmataceae bacterium]